ncbi:unnamed protein product, partial [Ixodes hexagonus]
GSINSYTEGHYKPPWLTDEELKNVILQERTVTGAASSSCQNLCSRRSATPRYAHSFILPMYTLRRVPKERIYRTCFRCVSGQVGWNHSSRSAMYPCTAEATASRPSNDLLSQNRGDLLGQSWFDILHPKDIAKVKEQLSSSDLSPKERLIDAKTMLPLKGDFPQRQSRLCPGARRSFFCRMRCKTQATVKEEADTTTGGQRRRKSHSFDRRYSVVHCTGYLKSWAPAKLHLPDEAADSGDNEGCNLSCLVAVGRVHGELTTVAQSRGALDVEPIQFVSRHAMDGKFLFVDKKATLILGYLPQELLGTACYEYYSQDDVLPLSECHKKGKYFHFLQTTESVCTQPYKFRVKGGSFVCLQTKWKTFKNPWTKEFECLVATNTLLRSQEVAIVDSSNGQMDDLLVSGTQQMAAAPRPSSDAGLRSLPPEPSCEKQLPTALAGRLTAGKIGRQVIEHILGSTAKTKDAPQNASSSTLPDASCRTAVSGQPSTSEEAAKALSSPSTSVAGRADHNGNNVRPESPETRELDRAAAGFSTTSPGSVVIAESELELMDSLVSRDILSSGTQGNSEGNDEAAMAVIMSLLEADAGLGGPVDFSGIPWPLP